MESKNLRSNGARKSGEFLSNESTKSATASGRLDNRSADRSSDRSTEAKSNSFTVGEIGHEIGQQLMAHLPDKLREDIDILLEESDHTLRGARDYVRENPREALGLVIGVGALA